MASSWEGFDLIRFWEESDYAREKYVEPKPTQEMIDSIQAELGHKLPSSYIELMMTQNGGIPRDTNFPTSEATSWAKDHVAISGIMGIGRSISYSLCGELGSRFMQEEWEYPEIGICVCNCPSAGHDMVMLDYRKCGRDGEPEVVHVDQGHEYRITFLARNFEAFIRGLVNDSVYDTSAEDLKNSLATIESGSFSSLLTSLIAQCRGPDFGPIIRRICHSLAVDKGYFALHADEKSHLLYDLQFHLYASSFLVTNKKQYLDVYPGMIVFGDGDITTGGYAPDFVEEWFRKRLSDGDIVASSTGLEFSNEFIKTLMTRLAESQ